MAQEGVQLSKQQCDAIIAVLPVSSKHQFSANDPEGSAARIREDNSQRNTVIRELLQTITVVPELARDTERLKKEVQLALAAAPSLERVAETFPTGLSRISDEEITELLSIFDAWYYRRVEIGGILEFVPANDVSDPNGLYLARPDTLWFITQLEADRQRTYLRSKLKNHYLDDNPEVRGVLLSRLKVVLYETFVKATLAEGTAVGSIAGQSLGEKTTQETLNVHKAPGVAAARQAAASLSRAVELYNVSTPKVPSSSIYFKEPQTYDTLKIRSYELRSVLISNLLRSTYPIIIERARAAEPEVLKELEGLGIDWHGRFEKAFPALDRAFEPPDWILRLELSPELMYAYRITPKTVAETIEREMTAGVRCLYTPLAGMPVNEADGAPAPRSVPVVDVLVVLGAKGKSKGRPKKAEVEPSAVMAELDRRSFSDEAEYQLRVLFSRIAKFQVCGVPGITQLHPYSMPIVRFFSLVSLNAADTHELRFDTPLMRVEGVRGSQILAYVLWRLEMLGLTTSLNERQIANMVKLQRDKITLTGVKRSYADLLKNYSAIEPLTTFAQLIRDTPHATEAGIRSISVKLDQDTLERYGFSPPKTAQAKLMSLVARELQPKRIEAVDGGILNMDVDSTAYEKLVKVPSLYSFVIVTDDKITNLDKEEHTLELQLLPGYAKREISLRRVIEIAVRDSGAFGVKQKRTEQSYNLSITLSKDGYDRFIRGYDMIQNARASRVAAVQQWETEILIDVSTIVPTYNQWSYQTIGSNLKGVLSMSQVNPTCTTSDDPNEVFDLFGIEATAAYLVTELNRTSNQKRDIDPRHFGLVVDAMCVRATPASVSRHGKAEEGSEGMTKAAMEQASKTFLNNAVTGAQVNGQDPASRLLLGLKPTIGTQVATEKMEAVLTGQAVEILEGPRRAPPRNVGMRPGAQRFLQRKGESGQVKEPQRSVPKLSPASAHTPAIYSLKLE